LGALLVLQTGHTRETLGNPVHPRAVVVRRVLTSLMLLTFRSVRVETREVRHGQVHELDR
jgi:hypothetical protein